MTKTYTVDTFGRILPNNEEARVLIISDLYSRKENRLEVIKSYQVGKADKSNFFKSSLATFEYVEIELGQADYTSGSGSKYFYTKDGVYRLSNHWGTGIATCNWHLNGIELEEDRFGMQHSKTAVIGFAKWEDFIHVPTQEFDYDGPGEFFTTFDFFRN